jgi:hypothetical protein
VLGRWLVNTAARALGEAALTLPPALLLSGGLRTLLAGSPMFPRWSWLLPLVWWCAALRHSLLPGWGLGSGRRTAAAGALLLIAVFAATTTALFLFRLG